MPIRPKIKQLTTNTAIYGIGNLLSKLSAFLLIPVYTRYLSMSDVGIIAMLEMMELLIITVVPLGLINAVWRYIPESTKKDKAKILSSAFWCINGIGIIVFLVFVLNRELIASHLQLGIGGPGLILILVCNSFMFVGGQFILWILQFEQKPIKYLTLSLFQFLGVLILNILFVVFLSKGVMGVLYSKLIVYFILYLISVGFILRQAMVLPSIVLLRKLIKFGLPFVITGFVMPVLTLSDRYFLNLFISLDEIGVYSIAYKFGMLINMFLVIPLQRTLSPMIYRSGIGEESEAIYKDTMFYYAFLGSLFLIFTVYLSPMLLNYFATKDYMSGARIIPWIALAYYINGFRVFFRTGIVLKDRTSILGLIGLTTIILNLGLNYFLIQQYGIYGAVSATVISFLYAVASVFFASNRIIRIYWNWPRLGKLFIISIITIGLYISMVHFNVISAVSAVFFSLAFYSLSIYFSKTIGWREKSGIKLIFKRIYSGLKDKK